jgi:hypothetical protein
LAVYGSEGGDEGRETGGMLMAKAFTRRPGPASTNPLGMVVLSIGRFGAKGMMLSDPSRWVDDDVRMDCCNAKLHTQSS